MKKLLLVLLISTSIFANADCPKMQSGITKVYFDTSGIGYIQFPQNFCSLKYSLYVSAPHDSYTPVKFAAPVKNVAVNGAMISITDINGNPVVQGNSYPIYWIASSFD